jgi:Glycosyl transferases group 1
LSWRGSASRRPARLLPPMSDTRRAPASKISDVAEGHRGRPLRIAVAGSELFAERTVALLKSTGLDARRLVSGRSRRRNWKHALEVDLFLFVSGRARLHKLQRHLANLGVPTLIRWIGSDVVLDSVNASATVKRDAFHWCVTPWLQTELAEAGIVADVVPLTLTAVPRREPELPAEFTVLAYLPDHRSDFYGRDFIAELARRHPGVRFRLIAATSDEGLPSNVSALGWVDDMESLMAETTVYVRPTGHDGLSNLVLEALAFGRYVLWSYPFPGVETAGTLEAADEWLSGLHDRHVRRQLAPNHQGREAVMEMFNPEAVREDIRQRLEAIVAQGWRRSPGGFHERLSRLVLGTLRLIFRAGRKDRPRDRVTVAGVGL